MAKTPAAVRDLLMRVWAPARAAAEREAERLEKLQVDGFVAAAKEQGTEWKMAGTGRAQEDELLTRFLNKNYGLQMTYVPFKGGGAVAKQLAGEHVNSTVNNPSEALGFYEAGTVVPLAAFTPEWLPLFPDTPTFKELGYDIVGGAFRGVAAPLGTPQPIVDKLAEAFTETNKIIAKKQLDLGFVMTYATGDDALALVNKMRAAYGDVLNDIKNKKK